MLQSMTAKYRVIHIRGSPMLMHIVARVPSSKIDNDDVICGQRLKLSKHVVPQCQVEAAKRSQKDLRPTCR